MSEPLKKPRTAFVLALLALVLAAVLALIWAPMDSGSGLVVKMRGRFSIGDALAPTVAAVVIGIGGLLVLLERGRAVQNLTLGHVGYLMQFLAIVGVGLLIMRWAGPAVVWLSNLLTGDDLTYRALRTTMPWRHIGFFLGGTFIVAALKSRIEGRITLRALIVGVLASLALIALFDLPFEDLQLPPNGDL